MESNYIFAVFDTPKSLRLFWLRMLKCPISTSHSSTGTCFLGVFNILATQSEKHRIFLERVCELESVHIKMPGRISRISRRPSILGSSHSIVVIFFLLNENCSKKREVIISAPSRSCFSWTTWLCPRQCSISSIRGLKREKTQDLSAPKWVNRLFDAILYGSRGRVLKMFLCRQAESPEKTGVRKSPWEKDWVHGCYEKGE